MSEVHLYNPRQAGHLFEVPHTGTEGLCEDRVRDGPAWGGKGSNGRN